VTEALTGNRTVLTQTQITPDHRKTNAKPSEWNAAKGNFCGQGSWSWSPEQI